MAGIGIPESRKSNGHWRIQTRDLLPTRQSPAKAPSPGLAGARYPPPAQETVSLIADPESLSVPDEPVCRSPGTSCAHDSWEDPGRRGRRTHRTTPQSCAVTRNGWDCQRASPRQPRQMQHSAKPAHDPVATRVRARHPAHAYRLSGGTAELLRGTKLGHATHQGVLRVAATIGPTSINSTRRAVSKVSDTSRLTT